MDLTENKTNSPRQIPQSGNFVKAKLFDGAGKKLLLAVLTVVVVLAVGVGVWWGTEKIKIKIAQNRAVETQKSLETGTKSFNEAVTGKSGEKEFNIDEREKGYQTAVVEFEKVIKTAPLNMDVLLKLAGAYYNLSNLDKAAETFEKALVLSSSDALIYNNLGNVLRDSGKYLEAEEHYRRSIEINPSLAAPYFNLAIMLGGLENKKDEAIKALEEGLNKNPGEEILKELLETYKK